MKRCPVCQSTYADDSLRFCLQDGATLEGARPTSDDFKTLVLPEHSAGGRDLPPTEIMGTQPTARAHQPSPTSPHRPRDTNLNTEPAITGRPQTRSTATVIGISVVATIALLALGGLTAWLLLRDKRDTTQRSDDAVNMNQTRPANTQNNTPPNINTRTTLNANTLPTPNATPAATPTTTTNPSADEAAVRAALNGWLTSFRARDIDEYMSYYANVLDVYYLSHNTGIERVRVDKVRAFTKFSTIEVWLNNIQVQVDSSGQRAVTMFTKSFRLSGPDVNTFDGSGLNRFTWTKTGGRWLITGEEDLKR